MENEMRYQPQLMRINEEIEQDEMKGNGGSQKSIDIDNPEIEITDNQIESPDLLFTSPIEI